ncbi:MAG: VCBS repeat-containing protein, partial [Fimbriimonadaceae bacterium]|nr:VCBS repeat-containing protein [Chitinophagales bacterium]
QSTDANLSRSVNWTDYDNDNDLDLFVTNEDEEPDNLYRNDGEGSFSKLTGEPIVTSAKSTMSSSWADIDNDLDLDLFAANAKYYAAQNDQLFINDGEGSFTEITTGDLVTDGGCSYGSAFSDFDNDGDQDLIVMNGYCTGSIVNFLYQNDGTGNFTRDYTSIDDLNTPCSYGGAWGDINNDGFQDLIIATCKNESSDPSPDNLFYLNDGNDNNWIKIKLTGTQSNTSAIGAKIFVKAIIDGETVWQMREISAQTGYCGQNSLIAHFGLGDAENIDSVNIIFPSGEDTTLVNITVNQLLSITEEPGIVSIHDIILNPEITIEPNPVHDILFLQINNMPLQNAYVEILDTTGKILYRSDITKPALQISIQGLLPAKGIYFIKVTSEDRSSTCTFSVQ